MNSSLVVHDEKKCQHDFVGDPFAMNYLKFRITDSSTWW